MEFIRGYMTGGTVHPVILVLAALVIFFWLAWAILPFSIFGIRRRLDRVVEALERLEKGLEQGGASFPAPPSIEESLQLEKRKPVTGLYVALRRSMHQFLPLIRETVYDSANVVWVCDLEEKGEIPLIYISLLDDRVEVTFPTHLLEQAIPRFSAEEFRQYASSFLPARYGYFLTPSPDGQELRISVEPREKNQLDLLVEILREKLIDLIQEGK